MIVDCACGEGAGSRVLIASGARQVIGIDADFEAVRIARRDVAGLRVICGDGASLPLRPASADVFVALETIEHIADAGAFVAEARRVLVAGGVLVCSTPNRNVTNPGTTLEDRPFNPHHVREYAPGELRAELERHFRVVKLLGHGIEPHGRARAFRWIAAHVSKRAAARLRQAAKLPRLIYDKKARYRIQETFEQCEYLLALCTDGELPDRGT